jgi:alpha-1,3/alpha-1,6-mannosyltransferase
MGLFNTLSYSGGAERLIVDAAMALRRHNHHVHLCTSHHDKSHCFKETIDGSLSVSVYGDWLPRSFFGKGHVLCAWIRSIFLACIVMWWVMTCRWNPDIFFVDQISISIPILKLMNRKVSQNYQALDRHHSYSIFFTPCRCSSIVTFQTCC